MSQVIVQIKNLCITLGGSVILNDLNLTINKGEKIAIIGPSGCGKTTLLRAILMLLKPKSGTITVFGLDNAKCSLDEAKFIRQQWGVMFQSGALFSSLTVMENVIFPMAEEFKLNKDLMNQIACFKVELVGLSREALMKYPAQLSGGMKKRVALARAIALDPTLVFLDEPTAGLDPKGADDFDQLILKLHKLLNLTFVMVTHDLDTLWRVPDRIIFLGEGKVLAQGSMAELVKTDHPVIQNYFSGPRGHHRYAVAGASDG